MANKTVRAFSFDNDVLEELKKIESMDMVNLSKFVNTAVKEKLELYYSMKYTEELEENV